MAQRPANVSEPQQVLAYLDSLRGGEETEETRAEYAIIERGAGPEGDYTLGRIPTEQPKQTDKVTLYSHTVAESVPQPEPDLAEDDGSGEETDEERKEREEREEQIRKSAEERRDRAAENENDDAGSKREQVNEAKKAAAKLKSPADKTL